MESLSRYGVRGVLFLSPPAPELLREKFPEVEAAGVAGASRAMTPAQMEREFDRRMRATAFTIPEHAGKAPAN
jgi:uncharacterized protein YgbK (DUF1537 family)